MKVFNYKTKRGTEIELTINSISDIEMYVKGKGRFKAFDSFDFDSEFNNCPSIKIDHKIDNKSIYVNITDEIYTFYGYWYWMYYSFRCVYGVYKYTI